MNVDLDLLQQLRASEAPVGPAALSCAGFTCWITVVPTVAPDEA